MAVDLEAELVQVVNSTNDKVAACAPNGMVKMLDDVFANEAMFNEAAKSIAREFPQSYPGALMKVMRHLNSAADGLGSESAFDASSQIAALLQASAYMIAAAPKQFQQVYISLFEHMVTTAIERSRRPK